MTDDIPTLGSCCICETYTDVTVILMLPLRSPIPGHGWGCAVCGLPSDGATAVFCEACYEFIEAGANPLFVCRGYPGSDGRIPFAELSDERFDHKNIDHNGAVL
jgi:hypothetical protein